jgi:hypothetical protein
LDFPNQLSKYEKLFLFHKAPLPPFSENSLFSAKNQSLLNFYGLLHFLTEKWTTDSFPGHQNASTLKFLSKAENFKNQDMPKFTSVPNSYKKLMIKLCCR